MVDIFGGQVTYGEDIQMHLVDPSTDTDIDTGTDTDADTDTDTDMEWTVEETTDGGIYLPELDMKFVLIEAGEFYMGSPPDELDRNDDEYRHLVRITQAYYMQETELTQAQWAAVMDGARPSVYENCDNCPVEQVSWDDIVNEFLPRLNALYGDRYDFNLPTEAQWEYAARAERDTPFSFGETLTTDQANYNGNPPYREDDPIGICREETTPVKTFDSNGWGLYDMHGNVYELCEDYYVEDYYQNSPLEDPSGPDSGSNRVMRGGCWMGPAELCRSADRASATAGRRSILTGFRLVAPLAGR